MCSVATVSKAHELMMKRIMYGVGQERESLRPFRTTVVLPCERLCAFGSAGLGQRSDRQAKAALPFSACCVVS